MKMESGDSCLAQGPSLLRNEDLMNQSKKKKKRKHSEARTPAPFFNLNNGCDEQLTKKPKKKNKSEKFNEGTVMESVPADDMVLPSSGEVENQVTGKKKSKKKRRQEYLASPEDSFVDPSIPSDLVEPSSDRDGNEGSLNNKKKEKKKRKSMNFDEDIEIIIDDRPASSNHAEASSSDVKKKKKRDKAEHSLEETSVPSVVSSDPNDETNEKTAKKKKKKKERSEEEVLVMPSASSHQNKSDEASESSPAKKKRRSEPSSEESASIPSSSADQRDELHETAAKKKKRRVSLEEESETSEIPFDIEAGSAERISMKSLHSNSSDLYIRPADVEFDEASERAVKECVIEGRVSFKHLPPTPVCPYCAKTFKNLRYRREHIQVIHLKIRKYECLVCSMRFGDKSTLRVHNRIHTRERNYACPYCELKFRNISNINVHIKVHLKTTDDVNESRLIAGSNKIKKKAKQSKTNTPVEKAIPKTEPVEEVLEDEDDIVGRLVALSKNPTW